ncbi:hypothetical protein FJZ19_00735 [Candidatus Pacearchaeota archaeon]|nr:hypothetical protein [Candidatus Pacearchaeota archaeon]
MSKEYRGADRREHREICIVCEKPEDDAKICELTGMALSSSPWWYDTFHERKQGKRFRFFLVLRGVVPSSLETAGELTLDYGGFALIRDGDGRQSPRGYISLRDDLAKEKYSRYIYPDRRIK